MRPWHASSVPVQMEQKRSAVYALERDLLNPQLPFDPPFHFEVRNHLPALHCVTLLCQDSAQYFSNGPAIMREMSRVPDVAFQAEIQQQVRTINNDQEANNICINMNLYI